MAGGSLPIDTILLDDDAPQSGGSLPLDVVLLDGEDPPEAGGPKTLMSAIGRAANADPALAGIAGGTWRGVLPRRLQGQAEPTTYCEFTRTRVSHLMLTSTSEWKDCTVRFRVYAPDGDSAEQLGKALEEAVRQWGSLSYAGGYSIPAIQVGGLSGPTNNRTQGQKGAWYCEATFSFRFRRPVPPR